MNETENNENVLNKAHKNMKWMFVYPISLLDFTKE